MSMLEADGVTRSFAGLKAVDNVTLTIESGEVRGLIGSNGAGKSTLLHLIYGQLDVDRGVIRYKGSDVSDLSAGMRARRGMGLVFQVANVFDELTVEQNLTIGALPKELGSKAPLDGGSIADVLTRLELDGVKHERAGHLSHGQRQWLEMGMVLLTNPSLLLLDEPTSGMTHDETTRTAKLLRDLQRTGIVESMLVVEHNIEFIKLVSDSVTVMHRGSVLAEGTIAEVQEDQQVRAAFLGRLQ